jgi:high-affinity nickel-transport protein
MALTLGIQHGFDLDHLATIDSVTRTVSHNQYLSRRVGFFFSFGHGLVVITISLIIGSGMMQSYIPEWLNAFGSWVSIVFLFIFGLLNVWNIRHIHTKSVSSRYSRVSSFADVPRLDRGIQGSHSGIGSLDSAVKPRNVGNLGLSCYIERIPKPVASTHLVYHLSRHFMTKDVKPLWIMFIGALFAFSFDTFSQVALFSISANLIYGCLFSVMLGVMFMVGMMLTDGINGLFVSALIQRADGVSLLISRVAGLLIALFSLSIAVFNLTKMMTGHA